MLVQFPAGRYHATPPEHHVNEGQIEWPPSPWRLLRALLAAGYNTLGWDAGLETPWTSGPPDTAQGLILKLARDLPSYSLPSGLSTHSRHYMPTAALDKGRERTTLVFDTWARLKGRTLAVTWDAELTADETSLLADLVSRLGYLGRSESWIHARLAGPDDEIPFTNCVPEDQLAPPGPGWEQVPLLTPQDPGEYGRWREAALSGALAPLQAAAGKKPNKSLRQKQAAAAEPYPPDLIACLQADTNWLRQFGWSQPPGSRRVFYWRPRDLLEPSAPHPTSGACRAPSVECMLLSLATDSGNDHALPPVTRTLPQAEILHRKLVGIVNRICGYSQVLSGCDKHGKPLAGSHEHAHVLPLDLDGDGHLEHILIWAPMGLDHDAQRAIRAARSTYTKGSVGELKIALEAAGALEDLRRLPEQLGRSIGSLLGPRNGACTWESYTPFVAPRYVKPRGKNSLDGQVQAELSVRGLPANVAVEHIARLERTAEVRLLEPGESGSGRGTKAVDLQFNRLRHFVRVRRNGPAPPADYGHPLQLRFSEPVKGPLCLGYGSHYGLGLFGTSNRVG
jgi:CRISPR-associated protein Csb2